MSTHRKSVAFSEDTKVVAENGDVTEGGHADKTSAESHSTEVPEPKSDPAVDEVDELFKGLGKKKKSKKPKEETADGGDEATPTGEGEFDAGIKKRKKKKAPKAETDDFEAKLAEAGVNENGEDKGDAPAAAEEDTPEGDMNEGTGIWAHDEQKPIKYDKLLERFFTILQTAHPDMLSTSSKSYVIPPPQCLREGNKKTIFANIPDICKRMKRSEEHVIQFIFGKQSAVANLEEALLRAEIAELGTSGSVDGSRRLVIKGRFQQKQIENVLRRYFGEYVTCKTCRSPDTELSKGENRLYFISCNSCQSRRSVTAIKTGYSAQVGKRKRQQT